MQVKKFFQPPRAVILVLIVFSVLEIYLVRNLFVRIGGIPNIVDEIIVVLMFLVPLIFLYLLISLIVYLVGKRKK